MSEKKRILIVEDDPAIRRGIVDALQFEGYETISADRGDTGLKRALEDEFDLLLLDLILPGMGGLDILQQVREERGPTPVIILTARGEESDRIRGLKLGADDYVVKPFSVRELTARVEAVLRRSAERPAAVVEIELPDGAINLETREVRNGNQVVELSEREADILRYLAGHRGRPVSRDEIMSRVWHIDPRGVTTRTIDMHVARLREKLGDDPSQPTLIRTVRGKGYMLVELETAES